MTGEVTGQRQGRIPLTIRGAAGAAEVISAVVDTGFTESLTLPPEVVARLALPYQHDTQIMAADGRVLEVPVCSAEIWWNQRWRTIKVHVLDAGILAGMSMLYGHRLTIDAIDGGRIDISALP